MCEGQREARERETLEIAQLEKGEPEPPSRHRGYHSTKRSGRGTSLLLELEGAVGSPRRYPECHWPRGQRCSEAWRGVAHWAAPGMSL